MTESLKRKHVYLNLISKQIYPTVFFTFSIYISINRRYEEIKLKIANTQSS